MDFNQNCAEGHGHNCHCTGTFSCSHESLFLLKFKIIRWLEISLYHICCMPLVSCLLLMIMVLQVMIMEAVVLVVGWSPPFNIVLTSLIWSMLWHAKGFTYFQAFCGLNCFWTSSHNSPEHFGLVAKEINLSRILVFANGFTVILIILCNAANQWQEKKTSFGLSFCTLHITITCELLWIMSWMSSSYWYTG